MKLIRFGPREQEKPGVLVDGIRRDCSAYFVDWDRNFFQANGLEELQKLLRTEELSVVPQDARWGAPIARPGTILCVGLNFSDHARESGLESPAEPVLFMKSTNTISGPYDSVQIPQHSQKTDWEVELGIVLKRDALYLEGEAEAAECIAGFCVVNDLSEREFQLERSGQWVKGKSCPGFSPVGPWLSTVDEVREPMNLSMKLWVNDILRQDGNTRTMIFSPTYIIWYVSQFMQLEAGDLISTGTPPGVGLGMQPPTYLKVDDVVHLNIQGLGSQKQRFR